MRPSGRIHALSTARKPEIRGLSVLNPAQFGIGNAPLGNPRIRAARSTATAKLQQAIGGVWGKAVTLPATTLAALRPMLLDYGLWGFIEH